MGFSHIYYLDGLNTTSVSQGCTLDSASAIRLGAEWMFPGQGEVRSLQLSESIYLLGQQPVTFCPLLSSTLWLLLMLKDDLFVGFWIHFLAEVSQTQCFICSISQASFTWRSCAYACVLSHFSHVWLCATPWPVAHQAPLSMEFSRQEYWSGLSCLPSGDLPDPRNKLTSLMSPALEGEFFTTSVTWEAQKKLT